jgi:transposase-like protein
MDNTSSGLRNQASSSGSLNSSLYELSACWINTSEDVLLNNNNNNNNNCDAVNSNMVNKSIQVSSHISSSTPRKNKLRKLLHVARVNESRYKQRLAVLKKCVVKASGFGCNCSIQQVISHIGKYLKSDSLQFITLQLLMAQRHPKGRRYTDADKLQALALYNSGPKAYKHLASIFLLPSKVSLSNWLRNMKCSPGFHKESFNGLSERLKYMSNRDKNCTLLIDEISIKSNLQYDRHNDIIIGYEDYGHYCPRSCTKAKSALVFMLRGIASN